MTPSLAKDDALSPRLRVARWVAGYGAIACALPYLLLKIIWLGGGTLGVADPGMMSDASMVALNAITAGMDLVGIAIALAFTHQWGQRVPAWVVLPPMWVATGLLVKFVLAVPVAALVNALASANAPRVVRGPVQPWVYVVVYTSFAALGIGLMVAFLLYAKVRWASVLRGSTQTIRPGATHIVQVPLANTAALIAIAVGLLHLAWAVGIPVGLSAHAAARRTVLGALFDAIDAVIAVGAAAGVLMMVHRVRRIPFWLPLTVTWVCAGSLFAWGLWPLINVLGQTALVRDRPPEMALVNYAGLLKLIGGLVIGLVMLFLLAERRPATTELKGD